MWNNDAVTVTGEVTASGKGFAEIKTDGPCGGCSACLGGSESVRTLRINTDLALEVGDRVRIGTSSASFLKRAGFFYGLPLVMMTAAALTARYALGISEQVSAVLSLAAVPVCWLAVGTAFSKIKAKSYKIEKL